MTMAFDPSARTDMVAHFDAITSNQAEKARLVVCGQPGMDANTANTLMKMLGIHPLEGDGVDMDHKPLTEMMQPIHR